jgi:hypothetical protein
MPAVTFSVLYTKDLNKKRKRTFEGNLNLTDNGYATLIGEAGDELVTEKLAKSDCDKLQVHHLQIAAHVQCWLQAGTLLQRAPPAFMAWPGVLQCQLQGRQRKHRMRNNALQQQNKRMLVFNMSLSLHLPYMFNLHDAMHRWDEKTFVCLKATHLTLRLPALALLPSTKSQTLRQLHHMTQSSAHSMFRARQHNPCKCSRHRVMRLSKAALHLQRAHNSTQDVRTPPQQEKGEAPHTHQQHSQGAVRSNPSGLVRKPTWARPIAPCVHALCIVTRAQAATVHGIIAVVLADLCETTIVISHAKISDWMYPCQSWSKIGRGQGIPSTCSHDLVCHADEEVLQAFRDHIRSMTRADH